jgi:hypothetical protein
MASHSQSMPCHASSSARPIFHHVNKTPASAHSGTRRWAELLEQRPVSCSACHWQPGRSTKKMASMAWRSSTRGRWQPRGWGLRGGSKGAMRSHSSSGIRQSRRTCVWSSCIRVAPVVEKMSLQDTITIAYWDRLLSGCQSRSERAQGHHFTCGLVAFGILERERHDRALTIYKLKRKLSCHGRTLALPALERLTEAA